MKHLEIWKEVKIRGGFRAGWVFMMWIWWVWLTWICDWKIFFILRVLIYFLSFNQVINIRKNFKQFILETSFTLQRTFSSPMTFLLPKETGSWLCSLGAFLSSLEVSFSWYLEPFYSRVKPSGLPFLHPFLTLEITSTLSFPSILLFLFVAKMISFGIDITYTCI